MTDNLRDRIAGVIHARFESNYEPCPGCGQLADVVIAELRPQLAAWARMCVDSGDMTPMAQRLLHNILRQRND